MNYRGDWIEYQLAHKDPNKTRDRYNEAEYLEQRRQMLQEWADELLDCFLYANCVSCGHYPPLNCPFIELIFIELPPFERFRQTHMNDESLRQLQNELLDNPQKGDVIQGTGGLRKILMADPHRNKGKRGGARVIYYHVVAEREILLIAGYTKDQQANLSPHEKRILAELVKSI